MDIRVGIVELVHDSVDCRCDLGCVGIASATQSQWPGEIENTNGPTHLTISMGREWAEKRSTTWSRRSAGYCARALRMFCANACPDVSALWPAFRFAVPNSHRPIPDERAICPVHSTRPHRSLPIHPYSSPPDTAHSSYSPWLSSCTADTD
jgi:hypothetical protein